MIRHKDIRTTIRHYAPDRIDHRIDIMKRYQPLSSLKKVEVTQANEYRKVDVYTEQRSADVAIQS